MGTRSTGQSFGQIVTGPTGPTGPTVTGPTGPTGQGLGHGSLAEMSQYDLKENLTTTLLFGSKF